MADEPRTDATAEETKPTEDTGFDSIVDESEADTAKPETTEEAETTEETPEDESTEEVESISDEQYAKAEKLGISRSQADELGVENLPRVMRKLTPPDSAQVSDAPDVGDAAPEEVSGKRTGADLDPELYDTELLKSMADGDERVMAEVNRRLGPIQERLHELTVETELRQERESKAQFDRMIAGLEGYDKEFGTTTPTRTQQANRQAVRTQMRVEQSGREIEGLPSLPEDQLLQRALSSEHPTKAKQQAREEISSTLKKREKQNISRPTQTKGSKLTGKQKARRSVHAKLVAMGKAEQDDGAEDTDERSGLMD